MDATRPKFGRGPRHRSLNETACEQTVEESFKKVRIKANLGHRKSVSEGSYLFLKDGSKGSRSSRNDVVLQLHSNLKRKQLRVEATEHRTAVSEDASIDEGPPTWRSQEEPSPEATRFQPGVQNSQCYKARQWQCPGNSTFEPDGLLLTSDCGRLANSILEEVVPDEDSERIQQGPPVPTRDVEESQIATLVIHEVYMKSGPVVQESCPDPPRPWARGIERVNNLLDMIDNDDVVNSVVSETTAVLSELPDSTWLDCSCIQDELAAMEQEDPAPEDDQADSASQQCAEVGFEDVDLDEDDLE